MIEHVLVGIDVTVKGLSGVLIPLGFDAYVTNTQAFFLYNLIAVALLFFIVAFSGSKSEAAFCVLIPLFAGLFQWFGWLRMADSSQQSSLVVLTIICGLLGVFIYMNEQNKKTSGLPAPGSKLITVALFLMFFSAALTMTSGFTIFSPGASQPVPGTCAAGFSCDQYHNIDFETTSASLSQNQGLGGGVASAIAALPGAVVGAIILLLNIMVGVFLFPVVLNGIVEGIWHGVSGNVMYLGFLACLELAILVVYVLGFYELIRGAPGSTI